MEDRTGPVIQVPSIQINEIEAAITEDQKDSPRSEVGRVCSFNIEDDNDTTAAPKSNLSQENSSKSPSRRSSGATTGISSVVAAKKWIQKTRKRVLDEVASKRNNGKYVYF